MLFQEEQIVNDNIYLIAIDQKSLEDMGPFNSWTRADMADAIAILNQDSENAPAVIGQGTFWKVVNLLMPIFILGIFGLIFNFMRKRKYTK